MVQMALGFEKAVRAHLLNPEKGACGEVCVTPPFQTAGNG